jgi:3-deoxy-D-manno-octulosonic-acid transferase
MFWVYRLLFLPLLILAAPYYLWRMLRRGGYGQGFSQRLGLFPALPAKNPSVSRIWIQAVSVGEIEAIGPFLQQLKAKGTVEIVVTTTTSTGYRLAQQRYGDLALAIGIFPIDFWCFSATAWNRIQPDKVILVEGELWPEHLHQAQARNIPAYLINGRLSDKSFARHQSWQKFSHALFSHFKLIAASSEEDARRFRALGLNPVVTGNLKFDVATTGPLSSHEKLSLRESLGFGHNPDTIVLLGSSTWSGEEAMLLDALQQLRSQQLDARLLLVPRHSERRAEVIEVIKASGFAWHQRSTQLPAPADTIVHLADTTGELRTLTRAADIAFSGKSLPPHEGGQTPIEAAAAGIALVYGPKMSNFRDICRGLEAAQAARRVETANEAINTLIDLAKNQNARETLGQNALTWHQQSRGATSRTVELILKA